MTALDAPTATPSQPNTAAVSTPTWAATRSVTGLLLLCTSCLPPRVPLMPDAAGGPTEPCSALPHTPPRRAGLLATLGSRPTALRHISQGPQDRAAASHAPRPPHSPRRYRRFLLPSLAPPAPYSGSHLLLPYQPCLWPLLSDVPAGTLGDRGLLVSSCSE